MQILEDIKIYWKRIIGYTLILLGVNLVLSMIALIFVKQEQDNVTEIVSFTSILISGIFAPFFEETLMRGIIQNQLKVKTNLSTRNIYIIVAILFSLFHLNLYFVPYLMTSLILSFVYDNSDKRLIVPVTIHCFYNLIVILLSIVFYN
ncbi:CPBP family intramembrane glutamic endopeptidase [Enterococcus sp. HMSC076E04]|uniref:CPBP family intramembrane glutamic endopeptidase n=1 Tax=Enterococcus sp. HMSC076E04 TaxID=1739465 RepID=UPI0008A5B082|nr:CAAX protease [Enterococcus sp. HMSC076E04]HBL1652542.1 CPBP family intramembrane metalloprotease [Enterococcus faecium]HBL2025573.1 CPBP family intramembrane metalloprotease [Enterococcus faecium]HBL2296200.1 CPBP family intramembrane metalloprotease [Enterococcus faecium]HBL3602864.1 CPBP family intramembrane metalloprotease [Enterococcus faecium]